METRNSQRMWDDQILGSVSSVPRTDFDTGHDVKAAALLIGMAMAFMDPIEVVDPTQPTQEEKDDIYDELHMLLVGARGKREGWLRAMRTLNHWHQGGGAYRSASLLFVDTLFGCYR